MLQLGTGAAHIVRRIHRVFHRRLLATGVLVAVLIPALFRHWSKVEHASEVLLLTLLVGLWWVAYNDRYRLHLPTQLVTLAAMATGVAAGVLWELGAFALDWAFKWDLQASNADTMTDFLWMDLAAIAGALLATRLYCRRLSTGLRADLGDEAAWLLGGPSRLLDRHPRLVGVGAALIIGVYIGVLWYVDRAFPGLPSR